MKVLVITSQNNSIILYICLWKTWRKNTIITTYSRLFFFTHYIQQGQAKHHFKLLQFVNGKFEFSQFWTWPYKIDLCFVFQVNWSYIRTLSKHTSPTKFVLSLFLAHLPMIMYVRPLFKIYQFSPYGLKIINIQRFSQMKDKNGILLVPIDRLYSLYVFVKICYTY